jgi:hypothetical protein
MIEIPRDAIAAGLLFLPLAVLALRSRRPRALAIAALIAAGWGCGSQEAADSTASAGKNSIEASDRVRPASHTAHVEYVDGFATIHCDGAHQIAVLEQLAEQAGFAVVAGNVDGRPISLQIERATLIDAIASILDGLEYDVEYAFDEATGTQILTQVAIGDAIGFEGAAASNAGQTGDFAPGAQRDSAEPTGDVDSSEQAELLAALDDPDPEARIDAIFWIDSDDESISRMITMLQSDPDPEVRASIVDRLGDEESPAAIVAVTSALQDSDSEVVLRAIDVLEFEAGDWLIPELERLLTHPDPEVRETAEDTITYLK